MSWKVRNIASIETLRARSTVTTEGCWQWLGTLNPDGYGYISINCRNWRVSRLAWTICHGEIPPGLMVCHHCDNRACCNPKHLFIGTALDNAADCRRKGRSALGDRNAARLYPERLARGEKQGRARLTVSDVLRIREMDAVMPKSRGQIAALFGVSHSTIQQVASLKTWRHL